MKGLFTQKCYYTRKLLFQFPIAQIIIYYFIYLGANAATAGDGDAQAEGHRISAECR